MRDYRLSLEANLADKSKFYSLIKETMAIIDTTETDLEPRVEASRGLKPKDWAAIINQLEVQLKSLMETIGTQSHEVGPEQTAELRLILDFGERFFCATRGRKHGAFLDSVAGVLKLDDWSLVVQALKIMRDYATRRGKRLGMGARLAYGPELFRWLLNIALCHNLKNNVKQSFLDMLQKPTEPVFQYYSLGPEATSDPSESVPRSPRKIEEVPAIRTVKLVQLSGRKEPARTLAQDLALKCSLPKDLFPALWCKARLAKTASESEESRYYPVLASLLAYDVFRKLIMSHDYMCASARGGERAGG